MIKSTLMIYCPIDQINNHAKCKSCMIIIILDCIMHLQEERQRGAPKMNQRWWEHRHSEGPLSMSWCWRGWFLWQLTLVMNPIIPSQVPQPTCYSHLLENLTSCYLFLTSCYWLAVTHLSPITGPSPVSTNLAEDKELIVRISATFNFNIVWKLIFSTLYDMNFSNISQNSFKWNCIL